MVIGQIFRTILGPSQAICGSSLLAASAHNLPEIYRSSSCLVNYLPCRGAARKGKRIARARENRLRANQRRLLAAQNPKPPKLFGKGLKVDKEQLRFVTERQLDQRLPDLPEDNVFFFSKFKRKRFSFDEAIEMHRQIVHPEVLNIPDALVSATFELNLKMAVKRRKYIENLDSTVCFPHPFSYQQRTRKIVALCKDLQSQNEAKEAGAFIVGSNEVVAELKSKRLTERDFDHIVCHTDFLVEFSAVKGMKGASFFPSSARGNFGNDIVGLVRYFKDGIDYRLRKNPMMKEFGFIDCHIGRLDMPIEHLKENFVTLCKSIARFRPSNLADGKEFFENVSITTPASEEIFMINFEDLYRFEDAASSEVNEQIEDQKDDKEDDRDEGGDEDNTKPKDEDDDGDEVKFSRS